MLRPAWMGLLLIIKAGMRGAQPSEPSHGNILGGSSCTHPCDQAPKVVCILVPRV